MRYLTGFNRNWKIKVLGGFVVAACIGVASSPVRAECVSLSEFSDIKLEAPCLTQKEAKTVRLRIFRATLAVAALSCNQQSQYNQLINTHQNFLVKEGQALRQLFNRVHKKQATSKLNRFVTHLSNRASLHRMTAQGYCSKMASIFEQAASLLPKDLMAYVQTRPIKTAFSTKSGSQTVASAEQLK